MDEAHLSLLREFRALTMKAEPNWLDVWELFVASPLVHRRVNQSAKGIMNQHDWEAIVLEDLQQEIWLQLGNRLRQSPGLSIDFELAETTFASWLKVVIRRLAVKAATHLQEHRSEMIPTSSLGTNDPGQHQVELKDSLSRLTVEQQLAVLHFLDGRCS